MSKTYFITNPKKVSNAFVSSTDIKCLSPHDFLEIDIEVTDDIIILCEIDIDKDNNPKNRTDFYGISFVQDLRRSNYKNKVLFVSFCQRTYLSNNTSFSIINTVGHEFFQLPLNLKKVKSKFESIDTLSEESLMVCKNNYCTNHGLIDTLTHSLRSNRQVSMAYLKLLKETIIKISSIYDIDYLTKIEFFDKNYTFLNEANIEEAIKFVENFGEEVKSKHPETESENELTVEALAPFEVLWLDDDADEESLLYKKITEPKDLNIKVYKCNSVDKAKSLISNDNLKRPNIMVAIVDYLLLENKDNVKIQQREQGYDFIKWIIKERFPIKILALSSMQRTLQNWLSESYGMSIKSIPKKAINLDSQSGVNYLVEEVISLANSNWMQLNRRPTSVSWEKYLLPSYIQIIRSRNYENIENEISQIALNWIYNYNITSLDPKIIKFVDNKYSHKSTNKNNYVSKQDNLFTNLIKTIEAVSNIKNPNDSLDNLINSVTNEINFIKKNIDAQSIDAKAWLKNSNKEVQTLKKEIKTKIQGKFKDIGLKYVTSKTDKNSLENFLEKIRNLVESIEFSDVNQVNMSLDLDYSNLEKSKYLFAGRRVLLYLSIIKGLKQKDVAKIINKTEGATKQVFSKWAALRIEDFPSGITIEEENWLPKYFSKELLGLGINIKKDVVTFHKHLNTISDFFDLFFKESLLKCLIINQTLSIEHDKEILFDNYNKPIFSSADEIKNLITFIVNKLDIHKQEEFTFFIKLWRKLFYYIKKLESKNRLGNLYSISHFLKNIKPKHYTDQIIEVNTSNITIEDEFIFLYEPLDLFFNRKKRTNPKYADISKNTFEIYRKICSDLNNTNIDELYKKYESPFFKDVKRRLKSRGVSMEKQHLQTFNIHPFIEIAALGKNRTNNQVYKIICECKSEIKTKFNELYRIIYGNGIAFDQIINRESCSNASAKAIEESDEMYWEAIPETLKEKLSIMITNFDDDFEGLQLITHFYNNPKPNPDTITTDKDLSSYEKVIVLLSNYFGETYSLVNPEDNLSNNDEYVVIGLK